MYTKTYTTEKELPKIVCLCGSTRYRELFMKMQAVETLRGNIVLSVGYFSHNPSGEWEKTELTDEHKAQLDELHKRKIDLADEILVINVDGYLGSSTQSEIAYCRMQGKPVRFCYESTDDGRSWQLTAQA